MEKIHQRTGALRHEWMVGKIGRLRAVQHGGGQFTPAGPHIVRPGSETPTRPPIVLRCDVHQFTRRHD